MDLKTLLNGVPNAMATVSSLPTNHDAVFNDQGDVTVLVSMDGTRHGPWQDVRQDA